MVNKLISFYGSSEALQKRAEEIKNIPAKTLKFVFLSDEMNKSLRTAAKALGLCPDDVILLVLDCFFRQSSEMRSDPCPLIERSISDIPIADI